MKLMQALSKKDQVVNFLRAKIHSEKLHPGTKLQSSRNLASQFATSKMVIELAYNILEKEGLVVKRARSGVFVNKIPALSHLKVIYILGIGVNKNENYFNEILKITYPPLLKDDFSYITRTYSNKISPGEVLDMEVATINTMHNVDCVLINAAPLSKKDVEKCLQINKPVIFLGDFKEGEINDIEFNQITGDNASLAEHQIKYMHHKGFKKITLFTGSLEHFFYKQFHDGAQQKADELGLRLSIVEFPKGISSLPLNQKKKIFQEILSQSIQKELIHNAGINTGFCKQNILSETFKELDKTFHQKIFFAPDVYIDYSILHTIIVARIEELLVSHNHPQKIRIKFSIKSRDQQ